MKKKPAKKTIVFVCTGNTCRSPMAEAVFKAFALQTGLTKLKIRSAGLRAKKGDTLNPKSAQTLFEAGLELPEFKPSRLTLATLRQSLAVVCMTDSQRDFVMDMRWQAFKDQETDETELENNVYSFSELAGYEVLDPYRRDMDCYRYVYHLIDNAKEVVLDKLVPEHTRDTYKEKVKTTGSSRKKKAVTTAKKGE